MSSSAGNPQRTGNNSNIKLFNTETFTTWIYSSINFLKKSITILTPYDPDSTIYCSQSIIIEKDLYVYGTIYNPMSKNKSDNLTNVYTEPINKEIEIKLLNILNLPIKKTSIDNYHGVGFDKNDIINYFPELLDSNNKIDEISYNKLIPIIIYRLQKLEQKLEQKI